MNFLLVSVSRVLYSRNSVGLERISFLNQLIHTFGIGAFDVR